MDATSLELSADASNYVLRLPKPYTHLIITSPKLDDAADILPILNDPRVYSWMGLPHPHEHKHALSWVQSVKVACELGQEDLRKFSTKEVAHHFIRECPVRILREVTEDKVIYLGDCGITKWGFPDVIDKEQREQLRMDNKAKATGDPTIIWSIGYYLNPNYHGKGVMNNVISSLISWATVNMNVRHIRTTVMEGNEPSLSVLKKNGFIVEKTLPDFAVKGEVRVGLHVFEWRAIS